MTPVRSPAPSFRAHPGLGFRRPHIKRVGSVDLGIEELRDKDIWKGIQFRIECPTG